MRVDVLGAVTVHGDGGAVTGAELGGRRARLVLVAVSLSGQVLSAEHLAGLIWGDNLPATWRVALRGIVRAIRMACRPIGGGGQNLIVTVPSGYRLAGGVDVDIRLAEDAVSKSSILLAENKPRASSDWSAPPSRMSGEELLPGQTSDWIDAQRRLVDSIAMRALELFGAASASAGDLEAAVAAARRAVVRSPMNEHCYRTLMAAQVRAGDRAGAVRTFDECRTVLIGQLGIEPTQETVAVYLDAMGGPVRAPRARLPTATDTFVGRDVDLAALGVALGRPGLVEVTGTAGAGKSRLTQQAALAHRGFPGGRLWVSVAGIGQDGLVPASVAMAVGVALGSDDPERSLVAWLVPLGRALLVLDGCEQVADGVASLVTELLVACPDLTVVATSRWPLGVEGERVVAVAPLPALAGRDVPALRSSPQVQLLLDRVRDSGAQLDLDERVAPHIAGLVDRCGGLPLALELVAAQLAAMPPGDLIDHIAEIGVQGNDPLRGVVMSSYALLDPDEATVFRRFSVLDGFVSLKIVRLVVSGGRIEKVRVVRILRELTARGLISVDRSGPHWQYRQDDELRQFARDLLSRAGEEPAAYRALAAAVGTEIPDDPRASPKGFQAAVNDMLGSLRSLFEASLTGRVDPSVGLELAFRLHRYFAVTNVAEGRFWLDSLLATSPSGRWAPHATYALGYLSYWAGDTAVAVSHLSTAVAMLDGVDDSYVARALVFLAGVFDDLDRGPEAVESVSRAIMAAAPFEADLQVSAAMAMASVLAEQGDPAAAGHAKDAIALCRRGASAEQLALTLPTAAMVCWQVGVLDQSRAYLREAQAMHHNPRTIAGVVMQSAAAGLAFTDGDFQTAVETGLRADTDAAALGVEREIPLIRITLARAYLSRRQYEAAAEHALAGLGTATSIGLSSPSAYCLDTAALIVEASSSSGAVADLLATAEALRARGRRRPLPALCEEVDALRANRPGGNALDVAEAAALARAALLTVAPSAADQARTT